VTSSESGITFVLSSSGDERRKAEKENKMALVRMTKFDGKDVDLNTDDLRYFGTLDTDSGAWPGFLSFENFLNWSDCYDCYHAPLPNKSSWEVISVDELPDSIRNLEHEDGYSILDHIVWIEECD
jgi:hypothetical protein